MVAAFTSEDAIKVIRVQREMQDAVAFYRSSSFREGGAVERIVCLAIGYAFGCVLSAEVVARIVTHESVFALGNGNPGMANVARSLGKGPALACLAGDVGKVVIAALVCQLLFPEMGTLATGWAGLGATIGHDFPAWHGFRGGKGVATLSAAIVLMAPVWSLVAVATAAATLLLTGYLSIAAVAAAGAFAVAMFVVGPVERALIAALFFVLALIGQWTNLLGIPRGTATRDLKR